MSESAVYRPHSEAPARADRYPIEASGAWQGVRAERFEYVSRGDFVPGLLYLPDGAETSPAPLILILHGSAGSKESDYLDCAARWVRAGAAVAAIDLPLHGARASAKLSERLITGIGQIRLDSQVDPESLILIEEFARQSTSDLVRALDVLSTIPEIDAERAVFVGFSLGAIVGSYLLAHDSRLRAAALLLAGGGAGPDHLDPATYLAQASRTDLLLIAAENDALVRRASSQALCDAASGPCELAVFEGDHESLPGEAFKKVWSFIQKPLGL